MNDEGLAALKPLTLLFTLNFSQGVYLDFT